MIPGTSSRISIVNMAGVAMVIALFWGCIVNGAVNIPAEAVLSILTGNVTDIKESWEFIVMNSRLPFTLTALFAGMALSVSGLLLQTIFQNPLAGPSVLGISSGSSLGVGLITLASASFFPLASQFFTNIVGALIGAAIMLLLILGMSTVLRSSLMLLIAGMMMSYLASSIISLLSFFATSESIKSFTMWGLGSYSAVTAESITLLIIPITCLLLFSYILVKPLNAMLLGDRYAASLGYSIRRIRTVALVVAGIFIAIVTAFCGPIAFIGLIVPHIARILTNSSEHRIVLTATIIYGAAVSLLCAMLSVLPSSYGIIPINAVTPCIGVPVIIYIIVFRRRLNYFN